MQMKLKVKYVDISVEWCGFGRIICGDLRVDTPYSLIEQNNIFVYHCLGLQNQHNVCLCKDILQ